MLRVVVLTHGPGHAAGGVASRLLEEGLDPAQVVVVHNPTEPGMATPEMPDPAIAVVQAPKNLGYARGMNLGMRRALEAGAEWVLLLTHDAEWRPGAVRALEEAARAHPEYAVLGPELEDTSKGTMFSYGVRMNRLGATRHVVQPPEAVDGIYPCESIDGAFTLLRADMLERVGLYDEKLFGYAEESELHLRARRAGWKVGVVAGARGGQDVGGLSRPGPYAYLMTRNGLNLAKLAAGWPGVAFGCARFAFYAAVYLRRVLDPRFDAEAKAHAKAYVTGVLRGAADYFRGRWGPPPETLAGMGDMRGL
ncbi:MAG: glycosyltransferase family 2 protein [Actinomycetota bacterium]|nr:glycosyltransferase family 2 protein [Actinomycetota bacterium]